MNAPNTLDAIEVRRIRSLPAKERCKRGLEYLNRVSPQWEKRVTSESLGQGFILAIIDDTDNDQAILDRGLRENEAVELGFALFPHDDVSREELVHEWGNVLRQLKTQGAH